MGSDQEFVDYVLDQLQDVGEIEAKKMFGEHGLYLNGKIVGLVCDNRLLVKPTEAGRAYLGEVVEAPAYPGAKPSFLIEEGLDDAEWLGELFKVTERELPAPKPKKKQS